MPNLSRSKEVMGRSKPDGRCKKHPKHRQSPGVCSVCLSEKLSQLSTRRSRTTSTTTMDSCSSSSLSSYYSSSSCSFYSSPINRYRYTTTEGKGSLRLFLSGKNSMLTKSRSLAFVPRMKGNKESGNDKKKGGFWSKLLRPRNKRIDEGLVHCSTMRERVILTGVA